MSASDRTSRPTPDRLPVRPAPPMRIAMCVVLTAATCTVAAAGDSFCALEDGREARLDGEEVVVKLREVPDSGAKEGCAIGRVDWPPPAVFDLLLDAGDYAEYMPHVEVSEVKRAEDGSYFNHQRLSLPFPIKDRHYTIHVVPSPPGEKRPGGGSGEWVLAWTYVDGSGNVKENRGSWRLRELASGQTLLVYRVFTDPGGLVPKWAVNRATRRSLPNVLRAVRARLEELQAAHEEDG